MNHHCCFIIPPDILKNIEKNAPTQAQRDTAKRAIVESDKLRNKRKELAPVPEPHAEGEDRKIYDAQNKTSLPGKLVRSEYENSVDDVSVNEAYDAIGNTYRLFLAEYGRSSLDGKGMPLIGTVHYDKNMDNAFWEGTQFAAGDGSYFNRFTKDLTVVAHELAHGVTQYTANLNYQGQSGALNEHISDVFGALVEQYAYIQTTDKAKWLIGELLCTGKINGRGLRDMLRPGTAYDDPVIGKDPQPADMSHYYKGPEDNGGVHINSGIPNRAFALACLAVSGFAWERVGQIWYKVLTTRTQPTTQFQEFANMTYVVAGEMFGKDSTEQLAVRSGWDTVEIDATKIGEPQPEPLPSPCQLDLMEILQDQATVQSLLALGKNPKVRRFVARIHQAMKVTGEE